MTERDIVVIGGSAGAIQALLAITRDLQPTFAGTIFIVVHISPGSPGLLPEILSREQGIPAQHAVHEARIEKGRIYIAPPNRHLLVDGDGTMRLTQGPKENRFRPAIDPLFRSAALGFGPRVVGVLLSGGMDDGVSGLGAIQDAGGVAVVQDVGDAVVPTLPFNALARLNVEFCLRAAEIGPLLSRLSQGEEPDAPRARKRSPMTRKEMELEVRQATASNELDSEFITLGEPSLLTCPECHGTLLRMKDERILRFRCHTGHAFTADSLLDALTEGVEEALWNAVRAIEESAMLLNHMAGHKPAQGGASATDFRQAAEAALARAKAVRTVIADNEDAREQVSRSATETAQAANGSRRTPSH